METKKVYVIEVGRSDHKQRKIVWDKRSEHNSFAEAQRVAIAVGERPYRIETRHVPAPAVSEVA